MNPCCAALRHAVSCCAGFEPCCAGLRHDVSYCAGFEPYCAVLSLNHTMRCAAWCHAVLVAWHVSACSREDLLQLVTPDSIHFFLFSPSARYETANSRSCVRCLHSLSRTGSHHWQGWMDDRPCASGYQVGWLTCLSISLSSVALFVEHTLVMHAACH